MKEKTLRKKIRRLEERLEKGPAKLAKLKRALRDLERKKLTARARETEEAKKPAPKPAAKQPQPKAIAAPAPKPSPARQKPAAKPRRVLKLSPERRAQLAEAMHARWAAKRAANSQRPSNQNEGMPPPGNPPPQS